MTASRDRSGNEHVDAKDSVRRRGGKYFRARWRHLLLTITADRITRGRLVGRHTAQKVIARPIEIVAPHWPRAFDGLRIVHVSDFHVGHLMTPERAVQVLEAVRELKPDLIACTGDVVDLDAHGAAPVFAALASCAAPLGVIAVLGNHDHLDDPHSVTRDAAKAGVLMLNDEVVAIGPPGSRLRIGGVDWGRTIRQCSRRVGRVWRAGEGVDLLLAHNPKAFVHAAKVGVPLTLSGHTHGRQFAFRAKPRTKVGFARRLNAGLYRRNDSMLFVTVGLGAWFPLRVNCPPEIALLTVRRG